MDASFISEQERRLCCRTITYYYNGQTHRSLLEVFYLFSSNPNRLMDSIGLQAQPPKFNGSTSHLGAAACICSSIFTGSIQKCTLKPRKMSLIAISSSPQQLTPKCSSERGDAATSSNGVGGTLSDACGGKFLQVVLVSPQIPGNVGCIARTCAAALVGLHLIEPLGFQVADAKLKRAGIGLHYWPYVVVKIHASWEDFKGHFRQQDGKKRLLAFTKRGQTIHSDFSYKQGDWLVFGSETSGLSPKVLVDCCNEAFGGGTIRIPMIETYVQCLNLAPSVGIALYEASRQLSYEQLQLPVKACINSPEAFISGDTFG